MGDKKTYTANIDGDAANFLLGDGNTFRDFTSYRNDVDQSGASISGEVKSALIEVRQEIDKTGLAELIKRSILVDYDKFTKEISKGDSKDATVVAQLWSGITQAVKQIPNAAKLLEGMAQLGGLIGLPIIS